MNLKIIFNALSCYNKDNIWTKPTCKTLYQIFFFLFMCLIVCPSIAILAVLTIIIVPILFGNIILGILATVIQIIGYVAVITMLDFDGKINIFLYANKGNLFIEGYNNLINYQTISYA